MRSWLTRTIVSSVAVVSVAAGPAAFALASPHHHARVHRTAAREAGATESQAEGSEATTGADGDATAQAVACQKAGVTGDNVQYDGQTGTCTADNNSGGGPNSQQQ